MIVFVSRGGQDLMGEQNTVTGMIEDVFCIQDMPRSDGTNIFLFPSIRPIRSTLFCVDIDGKRKKFNVFINSCDDIKTETEMRLIDNDIIDYLVQEYNRVREIIVRV